RAGLLRAMSSRIGRSDIVLSRCFGLAPAVFADSLQPLLIVKVGEHELAQPARLPIRVAPQDRAVVRYAIARELARSESVLRQRVDAKGAAELRRAGEVERKGEWRVGPGRQWK